MPKELVINTMPLISLLAGLGNLEILPFLYSRVHVPFAVCQEVLAGGKNNFGVSAFIQNNWLVKYTQPITISPLLRNSLDLGEASVIELALQHGISLVCIDEAAGRANCAFIGVRPYGNSWHFGESKTKGLYVIGK